MTDPNNTIVVVIYRFGLRRYFQGWTTFNSVKPGTPLQPTRTPLFSPNAIDALRMPLDGAQGLITQLLTIWIPQKAVQRHDVTFAAEYATPAS